MFTQYPESCAVIETETRNKSNKFSIMLKFIFRVLLIVAVLLPFMDTPSKKANRLIIRGGDPCSAMVNRPLPWDLPGNPYNLKQPTGNQILR